MRSRSGRADRPDRAIRRWRAACALCGLALCRPTAAGAQSIEEARDLYLSAEFRPAREAFSAALERGDLSEAEAAEAHVYLAALLLIEGDAGRAREHVVAALVREPGAPAPEGAPETLQPMMDEVRTALDRDAEPSTGLAITLAGEGGAARVRARLGQDLVSFVGELSLECSTEDATLGPVAGAPPEVELAVPAAAADLQCEARGVGRGGVELLRAHRAIEVVARARRRISPWAWVGVGAGVAATVVAIVLAVALPGGEVRVRSIEVEGW